MTLEQFSAHQTKRSKYRNEKTVSGDIKFDSKKECARYHQLKLMERAGLISDVKRQVPFVLAPSVKFSESKRAKPALRLIVDFTYMQDGELILEDVKSEATITPTFIVKRHILLANFGLHIKVYL